MEKTQSTEITETTLQESPDTMVVASPIKYRLNVDKIESLEDVKKVLDALCIEVTVMPGTTNETYEKIKPYLG